MWELKKRVREQRVGIVVIGHSLNHEGGENPIMGEVHKLAERLKAEDVQVFLEPEQFTSQEARRNQESAKDVDASAAALILNSYLAKKHPKSVLDT